MKNEVLLISVMQQILEGQSSIEEDMPRGSEEGLEGLRPALERHRWGMRGGMQSVAWRLTCGVVAVVIEHSWRKQKWP